MHRITTSLEERCGRGMLLALLGGLMAWAGCSRHYEHADLGLDSPQARQVQAMIAAARQGGLNGLDQTVHGQAAAGLNATQMATLRAVLGAMIQAGSIHLQAIDRFGPNVYRAVLVLEAGGKPRTQAMLLVKRADKLYWAGPN